MKCRIEAGHLRQIWIAMTKRLNHLDLARQMIWCIRYSPMQFGRTLEVISRGLAARQAVDNPMSHGADGPEHILRFKPLDQQLRSRLRGFGRPDDAPPIRCSSSTTASFPPHQFARAVHVVLASAAVLLDTQRT